LLKPDHLKIYWSKYFHWVVLIMVKLLGHTNLEPIFSMAQAYAQSPNLTLTKKYRLSILQSFSYFFLIYANIGVLLDRTQVFSENFIDQYIFLRV
jgi:hypothetical protein